MGLYLTTLLDALALELGRAVPASKFVGRFMGSTTVAGTGATGSALELRNPAASGRIILLERCGIHVAPAVGAAQATGSCSLQKRSADAVGGAAITPGRCNPIDYGAPVGVLFGGAGMTPGGALNEIFVTFAGPAAAAGSTAVQVDPTTGADFEALAWMPEGERRTLSLSAALVATTIIVARMRWSEWLP